MGVQTDAKTPPTESQATSEFHILDDGRGIDIKRWRIRNVQDVIASTAVEEQMSEQLGIKLPGMLFDKNLIQLKFNVPDAVGEAEATSSAELELQFNTVDALGMVGGLDPSIKVKAAERWDSKKERTDVEISTIKGASDWTFSTKYTGTLCSNGRKITGEPDGSVISSTGEMVPINYDALRDTSIPILFSAQTILFEDELDDNGTASYKVRIRVMPGFFFILARFFLRVDGVLIRTYDTRYYHEFGKPVIVRESVTREANLRSSMKDVHPSVLRDPDLASQKIPVCATKLENICLSSMQ